MKNNNAWYLISTKIRSEQLAQENLARQAYTSYLPLLKCQRRRNGRYTTQVEAFFPGYLFILLNSETDNWSPIRSTRGVSGLVRFGATPIAIPNGLIERLQGNEDAFGYQQMEQTQLKKGDPVSIIDGLFAGQQGIFQTMKGSERVRVLLNMIGKNTPATLSIHNLKLAV